MATMTAAMPMARTGWKPSQPPGLLTIGELDAEADLPRIAGLVRTYANLGGVTRTAGKERRAPMEA
jgi:hypothetical protein